MASPGIPISNAISKLLILFAISLAPVAAQARGRGKALVIVDWRGGWGGEEKTQVLDALAQGLDGAGFDRVEDQVSGFVVDKRFAGCIEREACRFEYARATGASYVIAVIMVKQAGQARAAGTLYNVPLLAESTVAVQQGKGTAAAIRGARKLIGDLLDKEKKMGRGTLELASAPPGDAVFIDGHAAGVTNLSQTLYAGPHVVRIERMGAQPHIAKVDIVPGKVVHYEARFERSMVPK
jgi:hypothetical protein